MKKAGNSRGSSNEERGQHGLPVQPKATEIPASAAEVLNSLFQSADQPLSDGFTRYKLERAWREVVGDGMAANTRPVDYREGNLILAVVSSVWVNQLWYFKDDIVKKVNAFLGKQWIKDIKFVVGR